MLKSIIVVMELSIFLSRDQVLPLEVSLYLSLGEMCMGFFWISNLAGELLHQRLYKGSVLSDNTKQFSKVV